MSHRSCIVWAVLAAQAHRETVSFINSVFVRVVSVIPVELLWIGSDCDCYGRRDADCEVVREPDNT